MKNKPAIQTGPETGIPAEAGRFPHIKLLLKRLLIVYLLFTICRALFFFFNYSQFNSYAAPEIIKAFFAGLLFDTSAIFYVNSLFILLHILPMNIRNSNGWQTFLKFLFLITNSIAILFNLIDLAWFPFANKRAGMEIFDMASDVRRQTGIYIADYWHLIVVFALLVFIMHWLYRRSMRKISSEVKMKQEVPLFILLAAVWLLGARGGLFLKPIQPYDAARFVIPELIPLTLNTPFQLLSTLQQTGVEPLEFFSKEEADALYYPIHDYKSADEFSRSNVVLIIVESMGKEYVGHYNNGKGYTPFLDSLCEHSLVFENAYANCKRSIEALPAILSGIPSWMPQPYIGSWYQSNSVSSIAKLLTEKGYDASFYHGGHNGTMGFDNYVRLSGSGKYSGKNEYPSEEDYDGNWGIFDEPYLQYFCSELDKKPVPFVSAVFTLSSHHPYALPEKYRDAFPKGEHPIHRTVRYTDLAIENFFRTAMKSKWFNNTIFVIVADHSSENITEKYQSSEGKYAIPLMIFKGDGSLKGNITATTQQIDIMNMVLALLNYKGKFFSFGKNPLDSMTAANSWAMQFDNSIYQMEDHPFFLQFDGTNIAGFSNAGQSANSADEQSRKGLMEKKLKAIIQQYHYYLVNNKMTIK